MNIQQLYEFCQSKKGVTEHFPFDEDTLVFKVGGKMFCLTSLKDWENGTPSLNLKCDPEEAIILREKYSEVTPGYYMNKKLWNSVKTTGKVSDKQMKEWILNSYKLVLEGLPKKTQKELTEE